MVFCNQATFLIFVIVTIVLVRVTKCLDKNGEGVCVARLSFREPRLKTNMIVVTKWCGKRKCKERKRTSQFITTWRIHPLCCNGWEYNGQLDICKPICSTGCHNGTCVAPDKCHCDPPFHLDPDRINTCIPYECDPPCNNANCWENACTCLSGYQQFNKTHCVHCGEGFTVGPDLSCEPKCEQECINKCTAPNNCSCLTGYKTKGDSACEPIFNCTNITPDTCSCLDGYDQVNSTHCTPKCDDCHNGDCVAPNHCKCNEGFSKINGTCKPVCSEACVNSLCSAPEVCSCLDGYDPVNSTHCTPKCDDCHNGDCVAPSHCKCNEGFSKINGTCKPVCSEACVNSACSAPGVCSCFDGYQKNDKNPHVCFKLGDVCKGVCNDGKCFKTFL